VSGGAVRLRIDLAYDGTDFAGWARQPGQRTVQGELEGALARLVASEHPIVTVGAGRTDAGVHARGQVAHADMQSQQYGVIADKPADRLNATTPDDIIISSVQLAEPDFDARFSATWRRYRYYLCDQESEFDPLARGFVLLWPKPLDETLMDEVAQQLVGEHDMAVFCRRRPNASTLRNLHSVSIERAGPWVTAEFVATSFCHSMVRSMVGALLAVGDGRRSAAWLNDLLGRPERDPEIHVAPAHGLVLEAVGYQASGSIAVSA
jgi:tRNA pseudouridine38-40 synthase